MVRRPECSDKTAIHLREQPHQGDSVAPANATATSAADQDRPAIAAGRERKKSSSTSPLVSSCSSITADGTATANQVAKFTAACKIHQSQIFRQRH